jgi:hypothetical protein
MLSCIQSFALQLDKGVGSVVQESAFVQGADAQANWQGRAKGVFVSIAVRNTAAEISVRLAK